MSITMCTTRPNRSAPSSVPSEGTAVPERHTPSAKERALARPRPWVQKARWAVGTLPRLVQGVLPRTADAVTDGPALSGRAREGWGRVLRVELAKGVDSTCVARLLSSDIVFL